MNKQKDIEEKLLAIQIANRALDNPNADPDSDICTISRQFLRLRETTSKELQELRVLNNETYEELLEERKLRKEIIEKQNEKNTDI